jgi:hypothetical protein
MFRIEAANEYGRNDVEKLGWCLVDIYEASHIVRIYRSYGSVLRDNQSPCLKLPKINTYHTKDRVMAPIGVHLRHPWAEIVALPYNGPIDEFIRKQVRNDYILLGLWECGIKKLRVPLSDLINEVTRIRMLAMTEMGHQFTVFSVGIPSGMKREVLKQNHNLVDAFEIVFSMRDAEKCIPDLLQFQKIMPVPLFLAPIAS